jgi:hypothetical protein
MAGFVEAVTIFASRAEEFGFTRTPGAGRLLEAVSVVTMIHLPGAIENAGNVRLSVNVAPDASLMTSPLTSPAST